jgi:SecD/SecF fusion protein
VKSGAAFIGGTQAKLKFQQPVSHATVEQLLIKAMQGRGIKPEAKALDISNDSYQPGQSTSYNEWNVKIQLPSDKAKPVFDAVQAELGAEPFFPASSVIGGAVASGTRIQALYALIASWFFMIIYLWVRFQRVAFGLAAVIALVHDVLVMLGAIALSYYIATPLGWLGIDQFKINLPIVAAFLTIIGYSVNDTIVIFDRIREIRGKDPKLTRKMVNDSTNQTLSRTLLTSFTVLLVVVVLYLFGGPAIHGFAFALIVGVATGTYSSVYVASPILLWLIGTPEQKKVPAEASKALA